jgi:hypothetical protein
LSGGQDKLTHPPTVADPKRKGRAVKTGTPYSTFTLLRWLVIAKPPKVASPLAVLALVVLTLVFWAGSGRVGWAQEDAAGNSPSLRFLDAPLTLKVGSQDDKKDVYVHVHNVAAGDS